jgi:hypothetical protein
MTKTRLNLVPLVVSLVIAFLSGAAELCSAYWKSDREMLFFLLALVSIAWLISVIYCFARAGILSGFASLIGAFPAFWVVWAGAIVLFSCFYDNGCF